MEIYREKVRDLLTPDKPLKLREHPQNGPHVQGFIRTIRPSRSFVFHFKYHVFLTLLRNAVPPMLIYVVLVRPWDQRPPLGALLLCIFLLTLLEQCFTVQRILQTSTSPHGITYNWMSLATRTKTIALYSRFTLNFGVNNKIFK